MRRSILKSGAVAALLLGLALAAPSQAQQDYPARPIRFITAAAQGGTSDILARIFAVHLTESLKQPVVVDNRASASGVIAGELTANAPPDGYTITGCLSDSDRKSTRLNSSHDQISYA